MALIPVTFRSGPSGDNVLTAVNVAKSCAMVGSDEKVIFVNATPQTAQSAPTLKFDLEDDHGSIEVITQVGPAASRRCGPK